MKGADWSNNKTDDCLGAGLARGVTSEDLVVGGPGQSVLVLRHELTSRAPSLRSLPLAPRPEEILPVIMDDDFCVPTRDSLVGSLQAWECSKEMVEDSLRIVMELFNAIAVTINAKRASALVLDVASRTLGERLRKEKPALGVF